MREKWEEDDDGCSDEAEELWSDEEEYALHLENMARLRALEMDESLAHRAGQRFVSFSQRTAGGGDVSGSGNSGQGRSVADLAGERMHREAEQIQMSKRAEAHQRLQSNTNYGPDGKPMFQVSNHHSL